jgi:hypothetical protein
MRTLALKTKISQERETQTTTTKKTKKKTNPSEQVSAH